MQIKGFFCYIQHSQNASDNFRTFIRYNEDQLYTKITTDLYQLKKEARSLISIQGLESAEYNYYMIPFTQYGYAYNFIRSGVFVVNDTNIPIVPITFNHITWYYDSNNNEFDLSFGAILTDLDPNITNVT
jgi:hypothetical protein